MARRKTQWVDTLIGTQIANSNNTLESLLGGLAVADTRDMTLLRMIVRLDVSAVPSAGAVGMQSFTFGIGIASADAFAIGITATPNPITEADEPPRGWVYRTRCMVSASAGNEIPPTLCHGDFRGMRKIEAGELFLRMENTPSDATSFTIRVIGIIRCLFAT